MFTEQLIPYFSKTGVANFENHFWPLQIFDQAIVRTVSPCEIYSFTCECLFDKNALLNDVELQNEEKLHWANARQEQCYGSFVSFNLAPLILHISRTERLVDADIFGYVWPV